jgi:hypothetical protein
LFSETTLAPGRSLSQEDIVSMETEADDNADEDSLRKEEEDA